ncbi:MAG: hypothetical protein K9K67_04335 [Bacteriovoracaceae bacterium]|nr:hypothetical protein [Bacteriovoracaceae bacterium]
MQVKDRKIFPLLGIQFLVTIFFALSNSFALTPLENVLLGNYAPEVYTEVSNPIESLFLRYDESVQQSSVLKMPLGYQMNSNLSKQDYFRARIKLGLFRGTIEEGFNLENLCKSNPQINYAITSDKLQAKRGFLATLQYLVMDITAHYLPLYAKYFEFDRDNYSNLVNGLITNSCSQNITTVSLKQLKLNMMKRFDQQTNIILPSIKGNPYFPQKLARQESRVSSRRNEFAWTLELFKSACSWGNDPENYGLLVPLLRSPVISSMVIRELEGKALSWADDLNQPTIEDSNKSVRISCQNLICRKSNLEDFLRQTPRSVGSTSIGSDFSRLYCSEFRDADYLIKFQVPQIAKKIKSITFDEQNLLTGQLIALITGVPDFLIQSPKFSDLVELTRSSMDQAWDFWANGQKETYEKALAYEEPLKVQVVPSTMYFKVFKPEFSVELDINQGEFDRVISIVGKLRTKMKLSFSKKFLKWARDEWKNLDQKEDLLKAERIKIPFRKMVEDQIASLITGYPVVPITSKIDDLIIVEILDQLATYRGDFFLKDITGLVDIPVYLNYGIFALRHMRDRYIIKKNQGDVVSDLQKLRSLRL